MPPACLTSLCQDLEFGTAPLPSSFLPVSPDGRGLHPAGLGAVEGGSGEPSRLRADYRAYSMHLQLINADLVSALARRVLESFDRISPRLRFLRTLDCVGGAFDG